MMMSQSVLRQICCQPLKYTFFQISRIIISKSNTEVVRKIEMVIHKVVHQTTAVNTTFNICPLSNIYTKHLMSLDNGANPHHHINKGPIG